MRKLGMRKFNTTSICVPSKHYMVDLSERVKEIKAMVDAGEYFCINRARQYGKTTTLAFLAGYLQTEYEVLSLDFQKISEAGFKSEEAFVQAFSRHVLTRGKQLSIPDHVIEELRDYIARTENKAVFDELFSSLSAWCNESDRPVVLMIDEVDTATNNQVFLDFLGQLRADYNAREENPAEKTFQSVILAGVTDVKHLKRKIRPEEKHKDNSPWNIAADFNIDMSLSETGIRGMLEEYEADHHTGMDTGMIAGQIRDYTNGYPFLVSRICQLIDERMVPEYFSGLSEAWTEEGITEAVKILLTEDNTLFDSLMGKLTNYKELNRQLERILLQGETIEYLPDNEEQKQLRMYGFIVNDHNTVAVANKIFEMRLYKKYVGESRFREDLRPDAIEHKPEFLGDGQLNIPLIMKQFIIRYEQIWGRTEDESRAEHFLEEEGRRRFLTYLSPIINGVGTYEIEPQTRDHRRMDVVIHYRGKRYVIELKIWHGLKRHTDGEAQILDYLNYWKLDVGYMLSFNFNQKKDQGVREVRIGDKLLYEGTV